ncbi:MAG: threonine ammonia-lyase [Bdellovibrio sp. CG10_big_fil_rev_8_21_14_0_10_47_8]|nr:MAG: threonine ammonia-lyase [Bdellovibrio sp. CG10_big_fil_rev_8_21_14_0_10_47_8]
MKVSLEDIRKAYETIRQQIKLTEIDQSISASKLVGREVYFKFENQQLTGSFKIRGALNKISSLSKEEKARGVVASSAGNHAQGVALSATRSGVKSVVVMPTTAALIKVQATKDYGAEVILHGQIYDEAYEHARALEKQHGYTFVHPYEDPFVIAGQGTIGLEVLEKIPDLDAIIVPIGGGGLISGIATAIKAIRPQCKVIGVQSDQTPGMERLFHHQTLSEPVKRITTIADGIAVKKPSPVMFDSFISKLVDEVVTVTDEEIAEAMVFLLERAKTVTEGSGAAGLAALLSRQLDLGKKVCVLLCGGNIDLNIMAKVIDKGLIRKGRLAELSVVVGDFPGNLSRMTQAIAELCGNILEVHHDRVSKGLYLRETKIDFILETTSEEHVQKIRESLIKAGGRIL